MPFNYLRRQNCTMQRKILTQHIFTRRSFLCVGLDPELSKIPAHLLAFPDPIFEFNKQIIDATRDLAVAYKPNLAFYEALGVQGWRTFTKTIKYIGNQHFIIADAKRGDIGNTSKMYAEAFFNKFKCDAVTVAPYMGKDSVQPFLQYKNKWAILLALTSNIGSLDFQMCPQEQTEEMLFAKVIRRAQEWSTPENLMFVIGATHADSFKLVREIAPQHFLLVPGVGAQGGDLEAIAKHGLTKDGGLLVNASRSIIYADSSEYFAEAARAEALKIQTLMSKLLSR